MALDLDGEGEARSIPIRLRRRPLYARLLRAPGLVAAHYRILRRVDDSFRWRAFATALRLTWAAIRP